MWPLQTLGQANEQLDLKQVPKGPEWQQACFLQGLDTIEPCLVKWVGQLRVTAVCLQVSNMGNWLSPALPNMTGCTNKH